MIQIHIQCTMDFLVQLSEQPYYSNQQQQESAIDIALPFITFYVTFQKIVSIRNSEL